MHSMPQSRRWFLRTGTLGLGGLCLADMLRMRAAAEQSSVAPDTAVILLWLAGGPPHLDMYDMKPGAPEEYRGPFHPIATNVPGLDLCELMPLHAQCADKFTLIRSIAHTFSDHGGGSKRFMTGRIPATPTETINDAPSVISIVAKMRERIELGLPNCVIAADGGREGVHTYAQGAAYLGPKYNAFGVGGNPNLPNFEIKNVTLHKDLVNGRLENRMELLREFDRLRSDIDTSGVMAAMDGFHQKAVSIMTSARTRKAFDLGDEPEALRARYGRNSWGQRALLARRLVQAGCSFVTVALENPNLRNTFYNWDTHAVNFDNFLDMRQRLPLYDQAVTALIEDLYAQRLDKKVLLIVTGEFGRSPKISQSNGPKGLRYGREHWPQSMSVLVSGGGMRHGQVVGSTNDKGEHPHDRPLTPNDLWATVYKHLGISSDSTINDYTGRPQHLLPFGEPIRELM